VTWLSRRIRGTPWDGVTWDQVVGQVIGQVMGQVMGQVVGQVMDQVIWKGEVGKKNENWGPEL